MRDGKWALTRAASPNIGRADVWHKALIVADSRQLVYWRGLLKRGDKQATCTVQVWEVKNHEGGPPAYERHRVIKASKRLPDGVYDLETQGQKLKVRRLNGFWIPADVNALEVSRWRPARIIADFVTVGGVVSVMLAALVVLRLIGAVVIR